MTPVLVFDLETIPDAQGLRRLNPQWGPDMTDTEVIEAALAARQASNGNDFLPLHLHKVAVVGCVFRDDNRVSVKTLGNADDPEPVLLAGFFKTIERYTPRLVSWNGSGFDLPVLHYRSLIHGIQAPRYWDMGEDDRDFKYNNYISRYHNRHTDLMDLLAKYNGRANAPLDDLAKLCGFPGKLGMGRQPGVARMVRGQGRRSASLLRNRCRQYLAVYCRFRLLRGELDHLPTTPRSRWYGRRCRPAVRRTGRNTLRAGDAPDASAIA